MKSWQMATIAGLCLVAILTCSVAGTLLLTPTVQAPTPLPPSTSTPRSTYTPEPTFTPTPTPSYGDNIGACLICRHFIRDKLKAPRDAKFPGCWEVTERFHEGTKTWSLNSYVDAPNSFGVMLRLEYYCQVKYLGGTEWQLLRLNYNE